MGSDCMLVSVFLLPVAVAVVEGQQHLIYGGELSQLMTGLLAPSIEFIEQIE